MKITFCMYDNGSVLLGLGRPWITLAKQRLNQLKFKVKQLIVLDEV